MQKLSKRVRFSRDREGDEVISIDQAEMKAYLNQMVEVQKQLDQEEAEMDGGQLIRCTFDKTA